MVWTGAQQHLALLVVAGIAGVAFGMPRSRMQPVDATFRIEVDGFAPGDARNGEPRTRQSPRRRSRRGPLVSIVVLVVVAVTVIVAATRDDRSGDLIEDERTNIRLALEVEHVIERICIPVD